MGFLFDRDFSSLLVKFKRGCLRYLNPRTSQLSATFYCLHHNCLFLFFFGFLKAEKDEE